MFRAHVFSATQVSSGQKMLLVRIPLHTMRPARLPAAVASPSCLRSYAHAPHSSTAESRTPSKRGGQTPCRTQVCRPKVDLVHSARCSSSPVLFARDCSFRVGLFLRMAAGGSLRRWMISSAQNPCFSNAITLFDDVRLIEGGGDFAIRGNPIASKCGMA